ncbi:MAG: glycosyltransferase family 2 protein [Hyphomicrobiales bacterium]|nr:glycosyltransferase family 2 protein [Hyphomicrobiales bacterium]
MNQPPTVAVVIVAYNSAAVINACLASLGTRLPIVVVDNASADASARIAKDAGATVIRNASNLGFARACNIGAAASASKHILFLNPDALMTEDAVARLAGVADAPGVAAAGPRLTEPDGACRFRAHTAMQPAPRVPAAPPEGRVCVSFLSGAALLCRRAAFEAAGGFDDNIFLYYEDDDLCRRLSAHGSLIYAPDVTARHSVGASSPRSLRADYARHYHRAVSRVYVSRKYGVELDAAAHFRRAGLRALRAALTGDLKRLARNGGSAHAYAARALAERRILAFPEGASRGDKRREAV